jgi:hypothetical protein
MTTTASWCTIENNVLYCGQKARQQTMKNAKLDEEIY